MSYLNAINESIRLREELIEQKVKIDQLTSMIVQVFRNGGKLFLCGNGGSAADAQHIAAEFVGKFYFHRPALPAAAFVTNNSILTAIGNDYSYEDVFSRQVEAWVTEKDVLIGLSTSGNSKNVIRAIERANELGAITIAFTGQGGEMAKCAKHVIAVNSTDTPRIQEIHMFVGHLICEFVEKELFGGAWDDHQ